jgi:anhydro-N-acetylmuramic acid kinase
MDALRRRLGGARLSTSDDHGLPSQAKEAVSFAILAAAAIRGEMNTLPSCTGADHAVVMGKIVPGVNYKDVMRKVLAV